MCSLVNTLPITKKNKYTVVTEAHKRKCLCCLSSSKFAPEGQFRLQLASFLRTSRRDRVLVRVSRPRSTRHFCGLFFCPSRASSQCFSQAPGASRSQYHLSSCSLTKYESRICNAAGCANTNDLGFKPLKSPMTLRLAPPCLYAPGVF